MPVAADGVSFKNLHPLEAGWYNMRMMTGECQPLLFIHILFFYHNHHHHNKHCGFADKARRELYVTSDELHLPSSKMSPRINTISGLSSHSAVWKALSICHSLCVWRQQV